MVVCCDISEFQPPVNDSYPHRWLIFRAFDGSHIDANFDANLRWAKTAVEAGRLDGYTVYFVYEPGDNSLARLDTIGVPRDCVVMIDVESWGGRIAGDHSGDLNSLANQLAVRQGSQSRVWGYANHADYTFLWPNRPTWLGLVVASYGSGEPSFPQMIGWQYTDGVYQVAGMPSATPPFGPCDHNILYIDTTTLQKIGVLMALTDAEQAEMLADVRAMKAAVDQLMHDGHAPGTVDTGDTIAKTLSTVQQLVNKVNAGFTMNINVDQLATAVAGKLPAVAGLTAADVKAAVKAALKEGVQ